MTIITIDTNKILLDRAMKRYLIDSCGYTINTLKTAGLKPLPPSLDTTVGNLKPEKIADIDRAYKSDTQSMLPIPQVNQVTSSYYSVQDGRHRIVMALCNNVSKIRVEVLNREPTSRSRSKSRSKSRSRSRSRSKGGSKHKNVSKLKSVSKPKSVTRLKSRNRQGSKRRKLNTVS